MKLNEIPHSRPWINKHDQLAVIKTIEGGYIAKGKKVCEFENEIANYTQTLGGVACNSGTSALVLALKALNINKGDEIILPTYVCWNVLSAIIGVGISTLLGTAAAFYGGKLDTYLMRQSDLVLMLPSLPFLFIISAFAELKVWHLAVVLGTLGGLGGSVITIKSQALQVKVKPFVDSARITGGSKRRIMFSQILPNVAPLALLYMVFSVTGAIASESVLSFLGLLNIDMSWGIMIYLSQTEGFIFTGLKYWWLIIPAGLAVTLLAGGFYLVGRGLDDVFNPRLRRR